MSHVYGYLPASQRPMATAIMMFGTNVIGLSLGPVIVGVISDFSAGSVGSPLGLGLASLQFFGIGAAWLFWRAGAYARSEHRS